MAISEGSYRFIVVRCQTIGCACKTAIDNVAVGPKGGLAVRSWSCNACGGEYTKSGNEILTIFASEIGVFERHQGRVPDSCQQTIKNTPAVDEQARSVQSTKDSEVISSKLAICVALVVFALIYVPVEACNSSYCVSYGWKWLWSLDHLQVSGLRLVIQFVIALIAATAIWRLDIESLAQGVTSPTVGLKTNPKPKLTNPDSPSLLNVWTKFILGFLTASLILKPISTLGVHAILQSAIMVLPLIPWFLAINKRHRIQKNKT